MGDLNPSNPESEGEGHLVALAQQFVQALGSKKTLTDDERKVLAELGSKLPTFNLLSSAEDRAEGVNETEERLKIIQERVTSMEDDQSMIWDSGPKEASRYLEAVDETQQLIRRLSLSQDDRKLELLARAYDILQASMARLEKEFKHILVQNRLPFKLDPMSFRSNEEDAAARCSFSSFEDESPFETPRRDRISWSSPEFTTELVRPDVIHDIKGIAKLMFISKYEQQCSQAFICVRKNALDECLHTLEIEKLNPEDVRRVEWESLSKKMKRWAWAMKLFVQVYLAREKWLHDQVFGDLGLSVSFVRATEASLGRLLKFAKAVAGSPPAPEKLSRLLLMYEVLNKLIPELEDLYPDEAGSSVRKECRAVLNSLGGCIRNTVLEYKKVLASYTSLNPPAGVGVQVLARFVMNHLDCLTDFKDCLDALLHDHALLSDHPPGADPPTNQCFRSLVSTLESNLEAQAKSCKDEALEHFFLMNNIRYLADFSKIPALGAMLGDEWIRNHNAKVRQHTLKYHRAALGSITSSISEAELQKAGYNSKPSGKLVKARLRSFQSAFEDIYKTQTGWFIKDPQLREELRTMVSSNLVNAYRSFVGKHVKGVGEKYMKYSPEELQEYLMHLFEGTQRSLPNSCRW